MIMAATFKNVVQAQLYALYRPGYPDTLRQGLVKYIQQRTTPPLSKQTVIDVGCGAGQSTFFLAKAGFGKVRGVDNSKAQIEEANAMLLNDPPHDVKSHCVEFEVVDANQGLSMPDSSVDVVTLGQALHWFDFPKFYEHVDRSLKPGGVFIGFGYGNCQVLDNNVQRLVGDFYHKKMAGYWTKERRFIDNHYRDIPMPYQMVERLEDEFTYGLSLSDLIGYISSWSAYNIYCKKHPGTTIMDDLKKKLVEAVESSPETMTRFNRKNAGTSGDRDIMTADLEIKFPLFALMCQKPK